MYKAHLVVLPLVATLAAVDQAAASSGHAITDIYVSNSNCRAGYSRVIDPSGSLNGDLNQGAGGDDVYLCASKTVQLAPITHVSISKSHCGNWQTARGLDGSDGNLNEGTSSIFKSTPTLRLCVFRHNGSPAISDVRLSPTRNMSAPYQLAQALYGANVDTNQGAGGRDIFLGVARAPSQYELGYSAGAASVPRITCGEGTVLQGTTCVAAESAASAFQRGVASVDITTDNAAEFQKGVASVDITSDNAEAFQRGVDSVDITSDNTAAFNLGVSSVDITTDNAAEFQRGVASVDITSDNQSAFNRGADTCDTTADIEARSNIEISKTHCMAMAYCGSEGEKMGEYATADRNFAQSFGDECGRLYDIGLDVTRMYGTGSFIGSRESLARRRAFEDGLRNTWGPICYEPASY